MHITPQEHQDIAHAIIMLTRTVSGRKARDFIDNQCTLHPIDYKPRGKTGWDSTISNHAVQLEQDEVDDCTPLNPAGIPDNREERCSLFYSCPKCGKVESSMCKSFQFNDLDKAHKCISCYQSSKINLWKCTCLVQVHTCLLHNKYCWQQFVKGSPLYGNAHLTQAIPPIAKLKAKKRKLIIPDSFEAMLASEIGNDHLRRSSPDSMIQLGKPIIQHIRAHLLGPILKKRFIDRISLEVPSEPPSCTV